MGAQTWTAAIPKFQSFDIFSLVCVCVHFFMKILPDRLKGTSLARYRPLKVAVVHFCSKTIGPSVVKVVAFTNQNFIYEYFWVGHVTTTKLGTRIFFA